MTGLLAALTLLAFVASLLWSQERARAKALAENVEFLHSHYTALLEQWTERCEVQSRILDQYRAEGIQRATYIDYGEPTPETTVPLAKEAETWLSGLDEEVREEYEGLIRARLGKGEDLASVIFELSTVA